MHASIFKKLVYSVDIGESLECDVKAWDKLVLKPTYNNFHLNGNNCSTE